MTKMTYKEALEMTKKKHPTLESAKTAAEQTMKNPNAPQKTPTLDDSALKRHEEAIEDLNNSSRVTGKIALMQDRTTRLGAVLPGSKYLREHNYENTYADQKENAQEANQLKKLQQEQANQKNNPAKPGLAACGHGHTAPNPFSGMSNPKPTPYK